MERLQQQHCLENKTWNEYLADQQRYFSGVSDVTFIFYPGTHFMNRSLEANGTKNLLITGTSPDAVVLTNSLPTKDLMVFTYFSGIAVEGITMELCVSNTVVNFSHGENASMQNIVLNNTCDNYITEILAEWVENITLSHVMSKAHDWCRSTIYFKCNVSGTINLMHSKFMKINFGNSLMEKPVVIIESCNFTDCDPAVFITRFVSTLVMKNVISFGDVCVSCYGADDTGLIYIVDSNFYRLSTTNAAMIIKNSVFQPMLPLVRFRNPSGLVVSSSSISLFNVTFTHNGIDDSSALSVQYSSLLLCNCNFTILVMHYLLIVAISRLLAPVFLKRMRVTKELQCI